MARSVATREYVMALLYSKCMSYSDILSRISEAISRTWPGDGDKGFTHIRYIDSADPGTVIRMLDQAGLLDRSNGCYRLKMDNLHPTEKAIVESVARLLELEGVV